MGVAIAAPELWEPVQEALRGLAVRVVMEQRDLRNWPSLIERLEFLRPEVVLLDITALPLPLEEAVRGVRAALPDCHAGGARHHGAAGDDSGRHARWARTSFCIPPLGDNLRKAVERRAEVRPAPRENSRPPGKVLRIPFGQRRLRRHHHRLPSGGGTGARQRAAGGAQPCWPIWTCNPEWSAS